MEKYIIQVESNCSDPEREDEYRNWYDNIHIPDVLETVGFVTASRYEIFEPAEGRGKFIAIYEIETDDYDAFTASHWKNMKEKESQNRMTELFSPVARSIYRQAFRKEGDKK